MKIINDYSNGAEACCQPLGPISGAYTLILKPLFTVVSVHFGRIIYFLRHGFSTRLGFIGLGECRLI